MDIMDILDKLAEEQVHAGIKICHKVNHPKCVQYFYCLIM